MCYSTLSVSQKVKRVRQTICLYLDQGLRTEICLHLSGLLSWGTKSEWLVLTPPVPQVETPHNNPTPPDDPVGTNTKSGPTTQPRVRDSVYW